MTTNDVKSRATPGTAALVATILLTISAGAGAASRTVRFDIPSGSAAAALTEFARQADVSVLFPFDEVRPVTAHAVKGEHSIDEGLRLLLADTGLQATLVEPEQFVVRWKSDASRRRGFLGRLFGAVQGTGASTRRRGASVANSRLEEIVVTARRREESLQDVPIAMTALTGNELERSNVTNVENLNVLLPNVNIRAAGVSSSVGQFVIRGIPGVSRYVDGVVRQDTAGALANLVDIGRVEVLRGPQGTLFGKNAFAGTIQYVTREPTEQADAGVKTTVGSYGRRDLVAHVDVPLSNSVFTRFTGASLNRDGYVRSDFTDTRFGNVNNQILRGKIAWRPSDSFDATLTTELNTVHQHLQANVLYDVIESNPHVQAYNARGLVFTDANDAYGGRHLYRNRSTYTGPGDLWHAVDMSLNVSWRIKPALTLRSITGGRNFQWGNYQDLDASEYAFFDQYDYEAHEERSQELQLQGTAEHFDWTLGLYYASAGFNHRDVRWQYQEVAPRPSNTLTHTATRDTAVFGEGNWDLTHRLGLSVGLRYSREHFDKAAYVPAEPLPPWKTLSRNLDRGPQIHANSADFDSLTPRLSLQYHWSDNVMTYASYAQGFNGGGINNAPVDGRYLPFGEESLSQYELGLHSDLLGRTLRFNASLFKGYWNDIQVGEVLVPGIITTRNAGEAQFQGAEIDTAWAPAPGLIVNGSIGWLDTRYTALGDTTTIRLDSEFALAPDWSYSLGASYDWSLRGGALLAMRLDYGWLDDHMTINDIRLQKRQPGYGLLSAQLSFKPARGNWEALLSGTNLTDQWYQLGGFSATLGGVDQGIVARPREIAFSLQLDF